MKANLEVTTSSGVILMSQLTNVLEETIDNTVSIHADNGFMINIPLDSCEMLERENVDIYKVDDGMQIIISFV